MSRPSITAGQFGSFVRPGSLAISLLGGAGRAGGWITAIGFGGGSWGAAATGPPAASGAAAPPARGGGATAGENGPAAANRFSGAARATDVGSVVASGWRWATGCGVVVGRTGTAGRAGSGATSADSFAVGLRPHPTRPRASRRAAAVRERMAAPRFLFPIRR